MSYHEEWCKPVHVANVSAYDKQEARTCRFRARAYTLEALAFAATMRRILIDMRTAEGKRRESLAESVWHDAISIVAYRRFAQTERFRALRFTAPRCACGAYLDRAFAARVVAADEAALRALNNERRGALCEAR